MSKEGVIWRHDKMPFLIGYNYSASNPYSLPDCMPFELVQDTETGVLCQTFNSQVNDALDLAYEKGSIIGPAMDGGAHQAYCDDFLLFIQSVQNLSETRFLEIGAGTGYLLAQVKAAGAEVLGIEPGASYSPSWAKYGVDVLNTFFPAKEVEGKHFDCIASYAVLEHIPDYKNFLKEQVQHLRDDGTIFISVPDCEPYFESLDPSCFLHEHYSYFTESSLANTLAYVGLDVVEVKKARYGGAIYAAARRRSSAQTIRPESLEIDDHFSDRLYKFSEFWSNRYKALSDLGKTVGVYCPSRALNVLKPEMQLRFFDDDLSIHGRFLPGFSSSIESFAGLIDAPVDELWIFSYTFGQKIKSKLVAEPRLKKMDISCVEDLQNPRSSFGSDVSEVQ